VATRKLAASTLKRFKKTLEDERDRLQGIIDVHSAAREEVRLAESSAERTPDPTTAEGGSMAFEFEKELSVDRNTRDLLSQVDKALLAIKDKSYGICSICGESIPIARLEALPHTLMCVSCAAGRR
jgi:RNA polymerase-binding protein DksA